MHWRLVAILALMISIVSNQDARASTIQLLNYEGGAQFSEGTPENAGFGIPQYLPMTLNYGPQGGSITFTAGALNPLEGYTAYDSQVFPINGQFFLNLGVPANGSNDSFAGPVLEISGTLTGTLTGPGDGFGDWRWSGTYGGTVTAAGLDPFNSQDLSQLPSPLLDILNNPGHLHLSVSVTGGDSSFLTATLTFDPPTPIPAPEPTTMITISVGVAAAIGRRKRANRP